MMFCVFIILLNLLCRFVVVVWFSFLVVMSVLFGVVWLKVWVVSSTNDMWYFRLFVIWVVVSQ